MIKKIIKLYWHEAEDTTQEHRTFKKSFARWRRHGFRGMQERLEKEYQQVKEDFIVDMGLEKRFTRLVVRTLFLTLFTLTTIYFMFIKSELYVSESALIVKDLNKAPSAAGLEFSLLGMGGDSQLQDSKVLEEYLRSLDFFTLIDKQFSLRKHYSSDALDFIERMPKDATIEEDLEFYRSRLHIEYDEVSGILHIAYAHTDPKTAQAILKFMMAQVETQLNVFNHRNAEKRLHFIAEEFAKEKEKLAQATQAMEAYQNKHMLLDPNNAAASSSTIIATLEASLTEKNIELANLRGYLNENNYEIKKTKGEIRSIKRSIAKKRKALSGNENNRLNKTLVDYGKLKMAVEFETEIYKSTLLQLESTKIDVAKEAKTLSIVSAPNLPEGYTYPNKPKIMITIVIVFFLLYGIFTMLAAIIRDHKE